MFDPPHPSCLMARRLPHRICVEQIFYPHQGKGSHCVNDKANFPTKPFCLRQNEQDRSRKKAEHTSRAENTEFVQAVERHVRLLLFSSLTRQ